MNKAPLAVVVTILAGCAAQQPPQPAAGATLAGSGASAATANQLVAAAVAPAAQFDVADFTSTTVCRDVIPTGTRMIRGQICTSGDNRTWAQKEYEDKRLQRDIDDVNRRQAESLRRYQEQMNGFFRIPR